MANDVVVRDRLEFNIGPVAQGDPGWTWLRIPQGMRFSPSRLVIPHTGNGEHFTIERLRIGDTDLLAASGPVPAGIFAETATGMIRGLGAPDAPPPAIALRVRNTGSKEPLELRGYFEGRLVAA